MADAQHPILVYNRMAANRRNTFLLLCLFALISFPFVAGLVVWLGTAIGTFLVPFASFVVLGQKVGGRVVDQMWAHPGITLPVAALVALAIVIATACLQYMYATRMVLRMAGARPVRRDQEPTLWRAVENLCIGAGLPMPRIYLVESGAPNAFATGPDPERAVLVVTRGLLMLLDRRELDGVIAHELSHIGNHDIRLNTILAAFVATLWLPIRFLFRSRLVGTICLIVSFLFFVLTLLSIVAVLLEVVVAVVFFLPQLKAQEAQLGKDAIIILGLLTWPWLFTGSAFYILAVAPAGGLLLRRVISQEREFLADADAALLTRDPEGLALALAKVGAARGAGMKVDAATAHLYVVNPVPRGAPWWDTLFSTHPPIAERVALLARMGSGILPSALRAAEEAGARYRATEPPAVVTEAPQGKGGPAVEDRVACGEDKEPGQIFCLTGAGATLYKRPDESSPPVAELPGGTLVTLVETEPGFLLVRTADNRFGYIVSSTPMTLSGQSAS